MTMKKIIYIIMCAILAVSCTENVQNASVVNDYPDIFPDYNGVTIPVGIAPMNISPVLDPLNTADERLIDVVVKGEKGGEVHSQGESTDFDIDEWHKLLEQNRGGKLTYSVSIKMGGQWYSYKEFPMFVSSQSLDEWGLTYRRVAPGYEVYSQMGLYQRDLSTFDEYEIIENTRTPGDCMNCHTSNRTNPDEFLFHMRGQHGATVVQKDGKVDVLNTKTDGVLGLCVYPYWHKDGRYVVFSTNTTRQEFHVVKDERIEVFDYESDLQMYDTQTHELIISPVITQKDQNESFPAFSADGKTVYFCNTTRRNFPAETRDVRYNLCSVGFDVATASWGDSVATVINVDSIGKSISIPKPSYDGKWLMYTLADYGTFPIWHKEADLWLLNLQTGESRKMDEVNSDDTESYHNWSDNSRWFVFSSRRGDGLYTRLYLSSIDENGKATKPFLLPQKNPREFYDRTLFSYNVPDFTKKKVEINIRYVASTIRGDERIPTKLRK